MRSPHIHSPTGDNDNQTHRSLSTSYVPGTIGSLQDRYLPLTEEHTGSERLRTFPKSHSKPEAFLVFPVGQEVVEVLREKRLPGGGGSALGGQALLTPCLFSIPCVFPQSPHLESPRASHQDPKSQLLLLEGPQGPVDSIPQPPSCDKTEAQFTQHGMESQDGSPGLLTAGSVLSPVQVAHARFSRVLPPLSVELIRVTHIHALLWLILLPGVCGAQSRVLKGA